MYVEVSGHHTLYSFDLKIYFRSLLAMPIEDEVIFYGRFVLIVREFHETAFNSFPLSPISLSTVDEMSHRNQEKLNSLTSSLQCFCFFQRIKTDDDIISLVFVKH